MKVQFLLTSCLSIVLTSTACTQSKRKGPSGTPNSSVKMQPPVRNTTVSQDPNSDFSEREKTIESMEQLLKDMDCQVTDTNLACKMPENHSRASDLAKLLENYKQVLTLQINSGLLPNDKKMAYQNRALPISDYLRKLDYEGKRFFSRDSSEVYFANQRLEALEIKMVREASEKTRDGISDRAWRMSVPSNLLAYKTPTQVIKEISNYIDTVEWFLDIYSGSKYLSNVEHDDYLRKVALLEELAVRINKIGSRN